MKKYSLLQEITKRYVFGKVYHHLRKSNSPLHEKIRKSRSVLNRISSRKPKGIIDKLTSHSTKKLANNIFSKDLENVAKKSPLVAKGIMATSVPATAAGYGAGLVLLPVPGGAEIGAISASAAPKYLSKGLNMIL